MSDNVLILDVATEPMHTEKQIKPGIYECNSLGKGMNMKNGHLGDLYINEDNKVGDIVYAYTVKRVKNMNMSYPCKVVGEWLGGDKIKVTNTNIYEKVEIVNNTSICQLQVEHFDVVTGKGGNKYIQLLDCHGTAVYDVIITPEKLIDYYNDCFTYRNYSIYRIKSRGGSDIYRLDNKTGELIYMRYDCPNIRTDITMGFMTKDFNEFIDCRDLDIVCINDKNMKYVSGNVYKNSAYYEGRTIIEMYREFGDKTFYGPLYISRDSEGNLVFQSVLGIPYIWDTTDVDYDSHPEHIDKYGFPTYLMPNDYYTKDKIAFSDLEGFIVESDYIFKV